jgi:outer membrane receptor protein involved in Fe transport
MRYLGRRPLIEDGTVKSKPTALMSARIGYDFAHRWRVSAEVFNLLNRRDSEIDYFYASRLPGEGLGPDDGGLRDVHFHPADPTTVRVSVSTTF